MSVFIATAHGMYRQWIGHGCIPGSQSGKTLVLRLCLGSGCGHPSKKFLSQRTGTKDVQSAKGA